MILWKLDFYLKRQRTGLKWKNWVIMCCYCYRSYCSNDTPLNKIRPSFHPTLEGKLFSNSILCFFQLFWRKKFAAKRKTNLWAGGEVRNFCKQVQANVPGTGNKVSICSNIRRNRVNSWQQGTTVSKQGTKCWITKECYCATARFWAREKMFIFIEKKCYTFI